MIRVLTHTEVSDTYHRPPIGSLWGNKVSGTLRGRAEDGLQSPLSLDGLLWLYKTFPIKFRSKGVAPCELWWYSFDLAEDITWEEV